MPADVSTLRRSAPRRRASSRYAVRRAVLLVGLVGLLALGLGLAFAGSKTQLAAGTEIAGVDVGGLTPAAARQRLRARAAEVERTPVTFVAGGHSWRIAPSQVGLRFDWASAIRAAQRESGGFGPVRGFRRIEARLFGAEVVPSVSVYPSVLAYKVDQIADAANRPAVEASVRRTGLKVAVVPGREGVRLDRAVASEAILGALASFERGRPVSLPTVVTTPKLAPADLAQAASDARVALSAPITLTLGPTRWRLPRWRIARLLVLPAHGSTKPTVAGPGAERWITELARSVNRAPVDATFSVRPGGIDVVPERKGRNLDVPATIAAVERAAFSEVDRSVRVIVRAADPDRSTEDAKAMGITGVVGSYTTSYGGTPGRIHNVSLVAKLIDGALVAPGDTFSFNQTTGERNADKGFEEAPVIINGELSSGIGGGVCQVSTTVFNAAFEAGLPIGRRTNHALYISHYPLGRDATVNYPDIDLTFSNDTGHWLLVRTFVNAGSLTVNLYGTPQGRVVESDTAPLTVTGKVPVKRIPDPELLKGKRVVETVGSPPRETSVYRRVLSPKDEILYENTWRSYYVGEPTIVRVGTKPRPHPDRVEAPKKTTSPAGPVAPDTAADTAQPVTGSETDGPRP